jgi:hypothetical protein
MYISLVIQNHSPNCHFSTFFIKYGKTFEISDLCPLFKTKKQQKISAARAFYFSIPICTLTDQTNSTQKLSAANIFL